MAHARTECFFCRWVNHLLVWRPTYRRVFNTQAMAQLAQAIALSETQHDAQIGVITERALPMSYLRRRAAPRERAITLFGKHRLWDTEHNTGILIYINWADHSVDIVADRGAVGKIPQAQWDAWAADIRAGFQRQDYVSTLQAVVESMSPVLQAAIPKRAAALGELSSAVKDAPVVL